MPSNGKSARRIRMEVAQLAARLIAVDGVPDYLAAKRKAALRLGVRPDRFMPTNLEIEQALADYQRLFQGDEQPARVTALRRTAVDAMNFLRPFRPYLVGPVLAGTATPQSEVLLHVYCNAAEEIACYLDEHGIPYSDTDRTVRVSGNGSVEFPAFRFIAGDAVIVLVVFDERQRHMNPLSPIDGKPMRRAAVAEVEALLEPAP